MLTPKIMLSGDAGTGKDDTATGVQFELRRKGIRTDYVSLGDTYFRPLAQKLGISIAELSKRCKNDPAYVHHDLEADLMLMRMFDEDRGLITTSRLGPALVTLSNIHRVKDPTSIIRICFGCEESVRLRRITVREFKKTHDKRRPTEDEIQTFLPLVKKETEIRQQADSERYLKLYGFKDIFAPEFFDKVIDTTDMSLEEQVAATYDFVLAKMAQRH